MEHWEEKLAELEPRLAAWYARFDPELKRLAKKKGGLFRKPSAAELDEAEREARAKVGEELLSEAAVLLDRVCLHYLAALPGERAKIRAHVGHHESVFRFYWTYLQSWPESIEDEDTLRLALAAASVHDLRSDFALVNELLGRMWLKAEELGIDPAPVFHEVAKVSSRTTGGGGVHFRDHLDGFEGSVYYKDFVVGRRLRRGARGAHEPRDPRNPRNKGQRAKAS